MGLDEAGRGSVLGPMVVGACWMDAASVGALVQAGATDSKQLSHKQRLARRESLAAIAGHAVRELTPAQIDAGNLNTLEEELFASLILEVRPDQVIIDAPCNPRGIPAFKARLLHRLGYTPALLVEPKADLNHAPCGAASIFAKVARDAAIEALGGEVGSGYPSDPITRAYLNGYLSRGEPLPACVRRRWGTLDALRQQALFG